MSKIISHALGAMTRRRANFVETDEDTDPKCVPLDFIGPQEAERRASKLIDAIGRDHAALVVETLRYGFSAGCWRIVSELQKQTAGG